MRLVPKPPPTPNRPAQTIADEQALVAWLIWDYLDWGAHYVGGEDAPPLPSREEAERVLGHFGAYVKSRLCVELR